MRKNIDDIHRALNAIPQGSTFEIRIIAGKEIYAGIFDNVEVACKAIEKCDIQGNYYFTLNHINNPKVTNVIKKRKRCIRKEDIDNIDWLFIDVDPIRNANTSSTDEQLASAKEKAEEVRQYLTDIGFTEPIFAMSGNGYHLLYRVDMPNTEENVKLIAKVLSFLNKEFGNREIKVDTVNYNPARICKLYGTESVKGVVHRLSSIISIPDVIIPNAADLLRSMLPVETKKYDVTTVRARTPYTPSADGDWLDYDIAVYHIPVVATEIKDGALWYYLDHCIFNPEHKDAAIKREYNPRTGRFDGKVSYCCFHDSCQDKKWKDVKKFYGIVHNPYITKMELTHQNFANVCRDNDIEIYWDIIARKLNINGKLFKTKERATLVRTAPQVLKELLVKANFKSVTNDNVQETMIVHATNNAKNRVKEVLENIPTKGTGEFNHLCELLKINSDNIHLLKMWLKQAYCMMYNDDDISYGLDFGLICTNPYIEDIMIKLAILEDFHTICVAPHSDHNFTTKLLTTSWICRIHSIPPKRKDWVTGICAAPYIIDTMPYKDTKIQFPHRTSYYSSDTELLQISDFWQLLTIPNDIDVDAILNIDYQNVWNDIIADIHNDFNQGYNVSNCFKILHTDYSKKPKADKANTTLPNDSAVATIINNIINSYPEGQEVKYAYTTIEDFKAQYTELAELKNVYIGKQLHQMNYTITRKKINGDTKRAYYLPVMFK